MSEDQKIYSFPEFLSIQAEKAVAAVSVGRRDFEAEKLLANWVIGSGQGDYIDTEIYTLTGAQIECASFFSAYRDNNDLDEEDEISADEAREAIDEDILTYGGLDCDWVTISDFVTPAGGRACFAYSVMPYPTSPMKWLGCFQNVDAVVAHLYNQGILIDGVDYSDEQLVGAVRAS